MVIMSTVLPRCPTDKCREVGGDRSVHRRGEVIAGRSPGGHIGKPKIRATVPEVEVLSRPEVLMGDGVPPAVEALQADTPPRCSSIKLAHSSPEGDREPAEVGADVAGIRVAGVELPAFAQPIGHDRPGPRLRQREHDVVDGLRVELAAEPLEV